VSERLLTARELAETLGVAPKTVLRWTDTRGLPGYRIGRALRYRERDVEAWLRRHATADGATEDESPPTDAVRQAQLNPNESPPMLRSLRSTATEEDN
jgi:excisionase family DNA binding protein